MTTLTPSVQVSLKCAAYPSLGVKPYVFEVNFTGAAPAVRIFDGAAKRFTLAHLTPELKRRVVKAARGC